MAIEPVSVEVRVPLLVEDAFDLFTRRIGEWWPLAYTFAGSRTETVAVDEGQGGRWFERDDDERETSWGEIRALRAPDMFTAAFAVSPTRSPEPPGQASEVTITFEPDGLYTRVSVHHHDWERHGPQAQAMRDGMASDQGWPVILAEYLRAARRQGAAEV